MIITTKYDLGDLVVLAYPHEVTTKKASFPDWEIVTTQCPGHVVAKVQQIIVRSNEDRMMGGIGYMYSVVEHCCNIKGQHLGNYFKEGDDHVVGKKEAE